MSSTNDAIGLRAVQESRIAMEKLIVKMDNLESGFDKIAERSRGFTIPLYRRTLISFNIVVLSASRHLHFRRRCKFTILLVSLVKKILENNMIFCFLSDRGGSEGNP